MNAASPDADRYDAIIIGAGVIGAGLALELARRGHRTLNVDKTASAGSGSTGNSCAIVRFSYSTVAGVNFSWEGAQYWKNWADHIGADDELGLIEYHQVGQLVLTTAEQDHSARVKELWAELDIPFEDLSVDEVVAISEEVHFHSKLLTCRFIINIMHHNSRSYMHQYTFIL